MKTTRSPQEKKQLSYERDRRGDYGDSNKASRKAIPYYKRLAARSYRRSTRQELPTNAVRAPGRPLEDDEASVLAVRRKRWTKWGGVPLAEFIATQQRKRVEHEGRKKRSREERRRSSM